MNFIEALRKTTEAQKCYGHSKYSNALTGNVSGGIVSMDDISPLSHKIPVKVSSKNLIPYPYYNSSGTLHGVEWTDNGDGTFTANGTSTSVSSSYRTLAHKTKPLFVKAGTYTFSFADEAAYDGKIKMRLFLADNQGNTLLMLKDFLATGTYTFSEDVYVTILISVPYEHTVENVIFKPQMEFGATATEYTPYIADDTEVTVKSLGKNLIPYPYTNTTKTTNGVTFTDNGDGSITIKGTAGDTGNANFVLCQSPEQLFNGLQRGKTYVMSCGGWANGVRMVFNYYPIASSSYVDGKWAVVESNDGAPSARTIPDDMQGVYLYLTVVKGSTVDVTIYPQIELGATATEHEPYIEGETITTTLAEAVELTSIAPNMTITTDNAGAVVEARYNKDVNIVIEKLTQAIISLGGNI